MNYTFSTKPVFIWLIESKNRVTHQYFFNQTLLHSKTGILPFRQYARFALPPAWQQLFLIQFIGSYCFYEQLPFIIFLYLTYGDSLFHLFSYSTLTKVLLSIRLL